MLLSLFLKENMFRKKKNNLSQNGSGKGKRPMGGGSLALNQGPCSVYTLTMSDSKPDPN